MSKDEIYGVSPIEVAEAYVKARNTEIVRTIQVDDKTVEVHIHLTEDEIRRVLLPLVMKTLTDEVRRNMGPPRWIPAEKKEQ